MPKPGTFVDGTVPVAADFNAGAAAWASWSPSYANLTIGNGTVTAGYGFFGRTVFYRWAFTLGSTSAVGTTPTISLPVGITGEIITARCWFFDTSATVHYPGSSTSNSLLTPAAHESSSTYARLFNLSATIPFTWATGDQITIAGTYEATS